MFSVGAGRRLGDQPSPESHCYRVCSASRLQFCQQVTHVGFYGFFGEEEPLADLAVDEAVRHELEHLDLSCSRLLLEFPLYGRRKRDHRTGPC